MTGRSALSVLQHLHRLAREQQVGKLSDCECLERFLTQRDEDAFAVLVRRHGPMVRGVCRRALGHAEDAEDVVQATFLVLARKAGSIRWQRSIAPWLYQVAYRLAHKGRVQAARRREQQATVEPAAPVVEESWREVCGVLDEELQALAEKYRAPLVLCYLEGQTRDEGVERLGWSLGTLKRRLQKGRELLRLRLTRRGVTLPAMLLSASLSGSEAEAALSTLAVRSLTQAATAFSSGGTLSGPYLPAIALAEAALRMMSVSTLKLTAVLLLTLSLAAAAGLWTCRMLFTESPPAQPASGPEAARDGGERQAAKIERPRTDRYGDPLPPGAVARVGTVRFREGDAIFALAYSPDGKMLASGTGYRETVIRLWDTATGKQLFLLKTSLGQIYSLAFSPDGKWLASVGTGPILVWDVAMRKPLRTFHDRESVVYTVAFSSDSRHLAVGGRDYTVRLWDLNSGKESLQFKGHQGIIWSFAFSPDGKMLATGSDDKTIRLWDTASGKEVCRLVNAKRSSCPYVAFSPDSKVVAGGSNDGTIFLWDAATGHEQLTIPGHGRWQNARGFSREGPALLVFSPDGKYLAAGNEGIVYYAATGKERCRLQNFHRWIRSLVFSPDGKTLAGEGNHRVRFWDAATGKEIFKDTAHHNSVFSVAFSADGKTLLTADRDNSAGMWETATGREHFRFQGSSRSDFDWHLSEIAVAPDGKTAAAWLAGALYTWDMRQPKPLRAYSDAVAGFDSRHGLAFLIHLWAKGMDKEPILLKTNNSVPNSLKFSPDGKTLASAGSDGAARLWDVATGKELRILPGVKGHPGPKGALSSAAASSLAFSPDSKTLALGGSDGTIGLWDKASGREIRHFVPSSPSKFGPSTRFLAGWQDCGCGLRRRHGAFLGSGHGQDAPAMANTYRQHPLARFFARRQVPCLRGFRHHGLDLDRS